MSAVLADLVSLRAAPALDLDAPLAIMPSFSRRGARSGFSAAAEVTAEPKAGAENRGRVEKMEQSAPSAETLCSWLQAVAERQDREAFARLHGFFAPRLGSWLARSGHSTALAEDIIQETMVAVWRKAGLYDRAQGGVSTWIFVIARNLRVDHLRRRANREADPLDDWDQIDDSPTGEDALLAAERERKVREALARLTREQAQVLEQAYFADKPQSAIARELGVPLGTVKSRVRLALARLRKLLEETA